MIRNKEDFKGKYIKLPKNLSKKKFNKIKNKLKRLGFEIFYCFKYVFIDLDSYMFLWKDGDIGIWGKKNIIEQIKNPQQISIKEFLKDKSNDYTIEIGLDSIRLKVTTISNDIKVKWSCYDKKEKLKTFKTKKEAIKWCHKNPMKEIEYKILWGSNKFRERYNPKVGTLGLEKYFEFKCNDNDWEFDKGCLLKNEEGINWRNIRECR